MSNILESALHEAVRYRNMEVLAAASEADIRAYLEELWNTVADFDILLEAGDTIGRAGIAGVDGWFREWFLSQAPYDEMVLDMGGAFLMGYWPNTKQSDDGVVERLLDGLELPGLGRNARDSLICALASAHRQLSDRNLANRIAACFERIRSVSADEDFQPVVEASLKLVRGGQGGDTR